MQDRPSSEAPRHRLIIAGSGSAGTAFLVRYFHALGLDAIENPLLDEFVKDVLTSNELVMDGVIIPVPWEPSPELPLLIERLARADIPMAFIDVTRMIGDGDYLFEKIRMFLPAGASIEQARRVHVSVREATSAASTSGGKATDDDLELVALRHELVSLRALNKTLRTECDGTLGTLKEAHGEIAQLKLQKSELERLRRQLWSEANELQSTVERQKAEYNAIIPLHESIKSRNLLIASQLDILSAERGALEKQCHRLEESLETSRLRLVHAERLLFEYLAGFTDETGALLSPHEGTALIAAMRDSFETMTEQLEKTNDDVTEAMARLSASSQPPTAPVDILRRIARRLRRNVRPVGTAG
jgi:hypothetical protein